MSSQQTPAPDNASSTSPAIQRLLARLGEMTSTISALRDEIKWLWGIVLGKHPELFVFSLVALALKAAAGDNQALSDMMSGFGRILGVDRWGIFTFDKQSRTRLLVGSGPDLPNPGEVIDIDNAQAARVMKIFSGDSRYVVCPAPGVEFDAFFSLKDETGKVWAILGLDDMSCAREFTRAEMDRIEEAVFLLEAVFNHRRRIKAEEIGLDTDPPSRRAPAANPTSSGDGETDDRTQMLGDGTPRVGSAAPTRVLGDRRGPGGNNN